MKKAPKVKTKKIGLENQPLANIEWVKPSTLKANGYNPNHVAPEEMELLSISIMEDGWTQPIVAKPDGTIVDGFHRWTQGHLEWIAEMTGGLVPVVRVDPTPEQQMMATIRHNRARGSHGVMKMADIVKTLIDVHGVTPEEVADRLKMEDEEVERLYDASGMTIRGSSEGFNSGWVPE